MKRTRARRGGTGAADKPKFTPVVDPTSLLLREITGVESKVPWIPLGIALLTLLWIPDLARLNTEPLRPQEQAWVQETLTPAPDVGTSAFSRELTQAAWEWQGAEIRSPELTPPQRLKARLPAMATGLVALFVFYFLGRLVIGDAAALLSACLLAIAAPWVRAGTSVMPLIWGEMFVLFGVLWALSLQGRHREVGVAPVNAARIGGAGVFLGVGMLLSPAAVATFGTTLLVWLLLGLRRSSSNATTLPVGRPGEITFFAIAGTVGLLLGALLSMWALEWLLGGVGRFPHLVPTLGSTELWVDVYRRLLSPGPMSDLMIALAVGVIALVRGIEWSAGRPWQAAGILPWVFLGLWVAAVHSDTARGSSLDVPLTVPPLFVLGAGWLVLRGLRPGVVRRQEYTFLVVWVLIGGLMVPFVGGELPLAQVLAACVVLLPPLALVAGRGARALWEAEQSLPARIAVIVLAYVPVVAFLLVAIDRIVPSGVPAVGRAGSWLNVHLTWIVLAAVVIGIVFQVITVRPDEGGRPAGSGRGGHSGRGRRGAGKRPTGRGGGRRSGGGGGRRSSGGQRRGGRRRGSTAR